MVRARRGRPRGEGWRPHRSWASVPTTPRAAPRKPGQCTQVPPRRGRAARPGRCRRGRAAPTHWPSDPGHSTARQESTSHNPPAQKPAPPGSAPRPSVPQKGEVVPPPNSEQSELDAATPATAAWSRKGQRYSSLGPPRHPGSPRQPDFEAGPRLASLRPRHEDEVPGQARPACHLLRNCLDDERVYSPRHTHRGARPRQYLGQILGGHLSRTRSHYLTLSKGGRPHQEMPLLAAQHGQPRQYLRLMGVGIRENHGEPSGESGEPSDASDGRGRLRRDRGPSPAQRAQPSVASEHCFKLLLKSTAESQAPSTTTFSVIAHERPERRRRSRGATRAKRLCMAISARSADDKSPARDVP